MATYYGQRYFSSSLSHSEKRDLDGTSVSNEKGTDGKKNNTSAYNHDYYMKNKEKWGVKTSEYTNGDSEMDDKYYSEENRISGTDFFAYKDKNGNWIILEEDMKWKLPAGENLTSDLKKKLMEIGNQRFNSAKDFQQAVENAINAESSDFDVDAAALDIIKGKYGNGKARKDALGDDYAKVQKRVNEMYAEGRF